MFESHPLRQVLPFAIAALAAMMVAGCSLLGPRSFGLSFPAEGVADGLPVLLTDHSGLVTSIDLADAGVGEPFEEGVVAVQGTMNALKVGWIGGLCDTKVDVVLRDAGKLILTHTTSVRPGDCEAMGLTRAIVVHFIRPVAPGEVNLVVER